MGVMAAIELTRARFEELRPGVPFDTTPVSEKLHGKPPRVNVVPPPNVTETFDHARSVGGNARPLWSRHAAVVGYFWGVDTVDAEDLFESWVAAAQRAYTQFSYRLVSAQWPNLGSEGTHGALYVVQMVIVVPVRDVAKKTVQPTTNTHEEPELDNS